MPALKYIVGRILQTIPVVAMTTVVVFAMLHFSGDPVGMIAGDYASKEDIEHIRQHLGLDKPILVQYFMWLDQLFHGELGNSIFSRLSVSTLISQRLEPTLLLGSLSLLITVLIAIPLGSIAALNVGGWLDYAIRTIPVLFSIPSFIISYLLIDIFSIKLDIFPVQGFKSPFTDGLKPFLWHITLPTLTLTLLSVPLIAKMTRTCILKTSQEDYIRAVRSKGQTELATLLYHSLPNSAVPIISTIGLTITTLIGGVVITESVFNIPGVGRLVLDAVLARDYPVIQGLILFFSLIYIQINLLVDLSYAYFDPRIRL